MRVSVSSNTGQAMPPFAAGVITVLVLVLVAVTPQASLLHALHAPHALTTQSTGHGALVRVSVSVNTGQAVPPFDAGVTTVLVLVLVASAPQASVLHALHSPHALTTQSTGHGVVLQACVDAGLGCGEQLPSATTLPN